MYEIVKRNKRLIIVDEEGWLVYCPPSFLRPVNSRDDYQPLVDAWNKTGIIGGDVLTEFESKWRSRRIE